MCHACHKSSMMTTDFLICWLSYKHCSWWQQNEVLGTHKACAFTLSHHLHSHSHMVGIAFPLLRPHVWTLTFNCTTCHVLQLRFAVISGRTSSWKAPHSLLKWSSDAATLFKIFQHLPFSLEESSWEVRRLFSVAKYSVKYCRFPCEGTERWKVPSLLSEQETAKKLV